MAATLGKSGIQPLREGCFDPVMTVDILDLSIEEKSSQQVDGGLEGAEWSLLGF
ncbi:hypothetical protein [Pseudomonas sp. 6D_7.1_Bac1]|uniref:hypothetical protein n=1 Tax=Pseudomonas sp. 6D_7.1_Bac1 TaxID=2971615 RepID=UPI0021C8640A|nr:hypothetical protein [Pseudomonas sp. 6D_7.1_Bac1]MCU1750915.1 hypothetical protein [Pseudomonas sp. 6D_7.1_Bac1]